MNLVELRFKINEELKQCSIKGKGFKKLNKKEKLFLQKFIEDNGHLNTDDFYMLQSRMWMDNKVEKSKNWLCIDEILSMNNSRLISNLKGE